MNDYLPLYARVRATLVERLTEGVWAPGAALPSEIALAGELGVSQGTVRKALDSLVADGALVRVQGRGTFVAEQTDETANFRFLKLRDSNGQPVIPDLVWQRGSVKPAPRSIAAALTVTAGSALHMIRRVREVGGRRMIHEQICVPDEIMPGLTLDGDLPNALYPHYQSRHGVSVLRTEDSLSAVPAQGGIAQRLRVDQGRPLLRCDRIAYDLRGRPVEHRLSHFVTDQLSYAADLG